MTIQSTASGSNGAEKKKFAPHVVPNLNAIRKIQRKHHLQKLEQEAEEKKKLSKQEKVEGAILIVQGEEKEPQSNNEDNPLMHGVVDC